MQERFPWLYLWREVTIIKYAWNVRARGWQCDWPHHVQFCQLASLIKSVQEIFSGRNLYAIIVCTRISSSTYKWYYFDFKENSIAWFVASIIFHGPLWTRAYEENWLKWNQMLKMKWNEKYRPYPDKEIRANLLALKRKDFFGVNNSLYCTRCGQQKVE